MSEEPNELCDRAIAQLDETLAGWPAQLSEEVGQAERTLARLRDLLIERHRAAPGSRAALDRTNAILSLVVGVEYPAAGLTRDVLGQARDELRKLAAELP